MLMSVREYAATQAVSPSTIQRRLGRGDLKGRKVGRAWFVDVQDLAQAKPALASAEMTNLALGGNDSEKSPTVKELISFSAKALNSYLMMSDRLLEEKEKTFEEKRIELCHYKQRVAELEAYVELLETSLFSGRSSNKNFLPQMSQGAA
jgi:hypothetical protein